MEDSRERTITVRLVFGRRQLIAMLAFALLALHPGDLSTESLTLTTYYPSPYGVYKELRSTENSYLAYSLAASRVGIGTQAPNAKLHIDGAGSGVQLGGASNTVLEQYAAGNSLKNRIDPAGVSYFNGGSFGIGTAAPGATLDVSGTGRVQQSMSVGTSMNVGTSMSVGTSMNVGTGMTVGAAMNSNSANITNTTTTNSLVVAQTIKTMCRTYGFTYGTGGGGTSSCPAGWAVTGSMEINGAVWSGTMVCCKLGAF